MTNFFVSYNKADRSWAEWIAWQLEEADYTTTVQAWDFRPGCNFVLEMQKASVDCERTIAVLSGEYLGAQFTQPEWAAAFATDPQGWERKLVPVKVSDCLLHGLLAQISHIDLVGLDETSAKQRLLLGVQAGRAKPASPPTFPAHHRHVAAKKPTFPAPHVHPPHIQTGPTQASLVMVFKRVYLFAVAEMYKPRSDAEEFAKKWVAEHPETDFDAFEEAYFFAVDQMYKPRSDAEAFALSQIK